MCVCVYVYVHIYIYIYIWKNKQYTKPPTSHDIHHHDRYHHVAQEIFHAEDEQAAELIAGHARGTATRSHDQGWPQASIAATEVEESLLQVI